MSSFEVLGRGDTQQKVSERNVVYLHAVLTCLQDVLLVTLDH